MALPSHCQPDLTGRTDLSRAVSQKPSTPSTVRELSGTGQSVALPYSKLVTKPLVFFCLDIDDELHQVGGMNGRLILSCAFSSGVALNAQVHEAAVKKNTVSVHTVERGSMSIFASANGTLTSLQPRRTELTVGTCETGRGARLVFGENQRSLVGKVTGRTEAGQCEVDIADALPEGVGVGRTMEELIVSDKLKDVVFFARLAGSQPHGSSAIFVPEGESQARRVAVQYGAMSGPLIQVLHGLRTGDRVIVTDMSKWADHPRVRLE